MRTLTVGTGSMRHPTLSPDEPAPTSAEPRFEEAQGLVMEAARRGCDIICLPELFADPSQGVNMDEWAEPLGGAATTWLSQMARQHQMNLIATVALRDGAAIANTGVIYNRAGQLAGTYRKVHLPDGERKIGTAGDEFGVFELEGVRIGMQICYDVGFPEGCRILALKGADIIFWPNMYGSMPEIHTDVIMRARAMENSVYLVSSAYVLNGDGFFRVPKIFGRSCIIDRSGMVLAEVGHRLGVAVATIEIGEAAKPGLDGTRFAHRLPHLYGPLVE